MVLCLRLFVCLCVRSFVPFFFFFFLRNESSGTVRVRVSLPTRGATMFSLLPGSRMQSLLDDIRREDHGAAGTELGSRRRRLFWLITGTICVCACMCVCAEHVVLKQRQQSFAFSFSFYFFMQPGFLNLPVMLLAGFPPLFAAACSQVWKAHVFSTPRETRLRAPHQSLMCG